MLTSIAAPVGLLHSIIAGLMLLACGSARAYDGPIIDAHNHWGANFGLERVIAKMDAQNVSAQVVMARYTGNPNSEDRPGTDEQVLENMKKHPGRFFPLVGMQRQAFVNMDWNKPTRDAERIYAEVDAKLASKEFYGMGEVMVRFFAYANPSQRAGEQDHPADSQHMERLAQIAVRHAVPIVIHMEGAPRQVVQLEVLLKRHPTLSLVWSHNCGRSSAAEVRRMLSQYPGLNCDLSNMTDTGNYGSQWPRAEPYTYQFERNGTILADMLQLVEDFPSRFMLGMDNFHTAGWKGPAFDMRAVRFRSLLDQMKPETARLIAHDNAVRIFQLK